MHRDVKLVKRAQQGDLKAFDELLRRYFTEVYRIAARYAAIPEDANDLTQETFITAYERLNQIQDLSKFGAWIAAIARNEGLMWVRRCRIQPPLISIDDQEASGEVLIGRASADIARQSRQREEIRDLVSNSLSLLTIHQRTAFELHYIQGYDYQETASLLNVPVSAVRGRLDRARCALRKELSTLSKVPPLEVELSASDLAAIRAAATFAFKTNEHPRINTICFTGDGYVVSTDTHRVFCYRSESLNDCPYFLLDASAGQILADQHPSAHEARLIIREEEIILRLNDKNEIQAPIIKDDYVPWRNCIPDTFKLNIKARAGDWLHALDKLTQHYEIPIGDDNQPRRMVMIASSAEERIRLSEGAGATEQESLAWETSVSFSAQFLTEHASFIIALNPVYVQQAILALQLSDEDSVLLEVNESLNPVLIRPAESDQIFVLTMPMQLPDSAKSEHS